jgi:hypothetical protein
MCNELNRHRRNFSNTLVVMKVVHVTLLSFGFSIRYASKQIDHRTQCKSPTSKWGILENAAASGKSVGTATP